MAADKSKIRYRLIQQDDDVMLPDALLDVYIADAQILVNQIDDTSTEYYVCYLMANQWQGLGIVTRQDGVAIQPPDPKKFLTAFNTHISKSGGYGKKFAKVSIDQRYKYDTDDLTFTPR